MSEMEAVATASSPSEDLDTDSLPEVSVSDQGAARDAWLSDLDVDDSRSYCSLRILLPLLHPQRVHSPHSMAAFSRTLFPDDEFLLDKWNAQITCCADDSMSDKIRQRAVEMSEDLRMGWNAGR